MNEQQTPNPLASLPDDEIDVWNFTDEQVEVIRRRLWAFKQHAGANKKAIPLKSLHYQILASEVTANAFDLDGSPNFKEEALRRFMRGITRRMDDDKLADAYRFLVEKKYLSKAEMKEEPLNIEQALLFHSYLSSSSDVAKALFKLLPGRYRASVIGRGVRDEVWVSISKCKTEDFFKVTEEFVRYRFEPAGEDESNIRKSYKVTEQDKELHKKRIGFGYICTKNNLLYIFLFGAKRNELGTYMQVAPTSFENQEHSISLMRAWEEFPPDLPKSERDAAFIKLRQLETNILRFRLAN